MPEHIFIALLIPIVAAGFVPLTARAVGQRIGWFVLLIVAFAGEGRKAREERERLIRALERQQT